MELKRRVGDRMSFVLLILGNIAAAVALSGQNFECTNDYDRWMFCDFEAQNCTGYNMTLRSTAGYGEVQCIIKQCDTGRCCCRTEMTLVTGETHNATILKGGEIVASKIISVTDSLKPRTPTITSVNESNGNFQVFWRTNMEDTSVDSLIANVTYHKKGDTEKVSEVIKPSTVNGLNLYEIPGGHLEPSTTYVVSVKSYINWSGLFSDSSEEVEFTTPVSTVYYVLAIIISLSIAAVIMSGATYVCYIKLKRKWWDSVATCSNPKLLNIHLSQHEALKPVPPIFSSVCVEPLIPDDSKSWSKGSLIDTSSGSHQHSSGISTGSSCLSYANTEPPDIKAGVQDALEKAFPGISPKSPSTNSLLTELKNDSSLFSAPSDLCGVRVDDTSSGSTGFDNKTYSILVSGPPHQITTDSSEVQLEAEILCDSAYHPSEGNTVICPDQQVPACLLVNLPSEVSSLMPTDMSYQQCNTDSGRFSYEEDSSLSSTSSDTNTIASCDPVSRVEVGCKGSEEVLGNATVLCGKTEEITICDENPCHGCVPTSSYSFPPVDDDYQAFQNLVEQSDILFSEPEGGEKEEHLSKYPEESFTKMPQSFFSPVDSGFMNNVQDDQCLSELQRPFLPVVSADKSIPVIADSGYQSV